MQDRTWDYKKNTITSYHSLANVPPPAHVLRTLRSSAMQFDLAGFTMLQQFTALRL